MQVIVEIMGADPLYLREQCEQWCREHLPRGIVDRDATADGLLKEFLRTVHPDTTGADALSVAIVD